MEEIIKDLPILYRLADDREETGNLPNFAKWVLSKDNGQDYVIGFRSGNEGLLLGNITPIKIQEKNHHRGGYEKIGKTEYIGLFISRENLDKWTKLGHDGYNLHCQC